MIIEIRSLSLKKWDASSVISLSYVKCDKILFVVLLTAILTIQNSSGIEQQNNNKHSYGGYFVSEKDAQAIATEANIRLAKIPCNFTTKTNCIYAEQQKSSLTVNDFIHPSQKKPNEIVVSWVHNSGIINTTEQKFGIDNGAYNTRSNTFITNNNVRGKPKNDFYIFNWLFEILACMMLVSAFEICLLVLRNLQNISLAFFGFWSSLNVRLQKFCTTCYATSSSNKTDQQRKHNIAMDEKRTLSYIFAILTWRASHTARGGKTSVEENLRDETSADAISYGNVTTMGDLLLLILFTHVYYQRQRFHQDVQNDVNADEEQLLKDDKYEKRSSSAYQKFYDKQNLNDSNYASNEQNHHRSAFNKRCSYFCGNMYQQISSLQERKSKLSHLISCTNKIRCLSCCTGIVWNTCCFCQYSCRSCCCCCSNCRLSNQRCYIYIPFCNAIYCCCFYKTLNSFYNANNQYCCYVYCWDDPCQISTYGSHATYRCCCHSCCSCTYNICCVCNTMANKKTVCAVNLLLLNKIRNSFLKVYNPSVDYSVWKLICNNQGYSILYEVNGQNYSVFYVTDCSSMFLYKRSYCQLAIDVFSTLMPNYLLTIKNYQAFLKWNKLHVAVVGMALVVICASSAGANYNQQHYNSLLNKCKRHFSRSQQNKRRRRRRRRRHQHCKAHRPQHYFYTTLIQYVKRQKTKKFHRKFVKKVHKEAAKLLTYSTTSYEHSLAPMPSKAPMVRGIRRVRGSKPNIVWLLIGLIWFEGPKIVNCNIIINYQNQQQHEQQQQQQHQQQAGNSHKEATTNSVNSNLEYKIENFNQMKTKNSNNNSNSNNNNNNNSNNNNKNKNKNSSNSNNNNNNSTNDINNSSTLDKKDIHLSVSVIPIINTIHFKHYCNNNYHQNLIRSSHRVQRALKTNTNLETSITSSAYLNYNKVNDDLEPESMPSSAFQTNNEESHVQSDLMRLESIKHQILFKLGLTRKPNVPHPLPKQFIWDTIYRADGIKSFHEFANTNNFQDHQYLTAQQNYRHWSTRPSKLANVVPMSNYQQRQQVEDPSDDLSDSADGINNVKRSQESVNTVRNKHGKQQLLQQQTLSKHKAIYKKLPTARSTSKNLNQLLYTTSNRNKFIHHTNKTVNNFTILKQSKHQQFHKNSQHSPLTTEKKIKIHQQQQTRRQYEQINQHTNNNIQKNKINNINNNVKNSNNNIIMVQKHLRDNNKNIEEANKFTYLTDISSRDDSLNNMKEYHNPDSDNNNGLLRNQNHHQPLPLHLQQRDVLNVKTFENYQRFNIDEFNDVGGNIGVDRHFPNLEPEEDGNDDVNDNYDVVGNQYHRQDHLQHQRHDNYVSKLDAFDENEDFFGSTQEIITFAEKGKMYRNHRLVEFSHQSNEKRKQNLHVRNAEIHIRIDKISLKKNSRAGSGIKRKRLKIWIFQLIENNYTYKGFDHAAQFCASFEVDTSSLGWKKFDITTTVKEWYSQRERKKLRLLIDCTGCGKMYAVHLFNDNNDKEYIEVRGRRIADERRNVKSVTDINNKHIYNVTHSNNNNQTFVIPERDGINRRNNLNFGKTDEQDVLNSNRPFLVLYIEARRQRRVRRRAINCNGALHGQCCKESFYVSFKALGWDDWIIAPRGYFANYCRGDCTGPYRTPDTFQTFHAHFIEEYRKMGLLNGMQPCCAPIKFSSMSLIYYGDEGIIKRDLPKMVVDECGCP